MALMLEFKGIAKFALVDFRRKSGATGWTNTALETARKVVTGDPAPYSIQPLGRGDQAVLKVIANMTAPSDTGSVKLKGTLVAQGATQDAESDAGSIASGGYLGLNLRFELVGA